MLAREDTQVGLKETEGLTCSHADNLLWLRTPLGETAAHCPALAACDDLRVESGVE